MTYFNREIYNYDNLKAENKEKIKSEVASDVVDAVKRRGCRTREA